MVLIESNKFQKAHTVCLNSRLRETINPIKDPLLYWGKHGKRDFLHLDKKLFPWSVGGLPLRFCRALKINNSRDFKKFLDKVLSRVRLSVGESTSVKFANIEIRIFYSGMGSEGEVYKISIPGGDIQPIAWKKYCWRDMLPRNVLADFYQDIMQKHYILTEKNIFKDLPYFLCGFIYKDHYNSFVEFITEEHSTRGRTGNSRKTNGYISEDTTGFGNTVNGFLVDVGGIRYKWLPDFIENLKL